MESNHELQQEVDRLKRQLKEQQRLLKAKDRELQTYLYTLSHEIKTPMISLRGFASLLLEDFRAILPQEAREYIDRIFKNVDRLETLVDDLVLLSGKHFEEKSFERIDLNDLVHEVISELNGEYACRPEWIQLADGLPAVYGYRQGIWHVFANLITNALKFRRDAVTPRIAIGFFNDELFTKFYVQDNGVGIPAKMRAKVFDMFTRAGNKSGASGNGLGLPIVRRIVEAHGGEIWLDSRMGRGTTFYFTLPNSQHTPAARAASTLLHCSSQNPTHHPVYEEIK